MLPLQAEVWLEAIARWEGKKNDEKDARRLEAFMTTIRDLAANKEGDNVVSLCSELLRLHEPLLFDFTKGELHFYAAYFEDRDWNRAYAHIQKAQECMQRALMPAAERREWSARIAETKENLLSVLDEVKAAEQQQEAAAAAERAGGDAAAEPATAAPASPTAESAEPSQAYSLGSGIVLTSRPARPGTFLGVNPPNVPPPMPAAPTTQAATTGDQEDEEMDVS